jgi:GntR family transcriptional regulator/MocR family aminotransferase
MESHLRRIRKRQGLKREALIDAIGETFGDDISVSDTQAGLNFIVRVKWIDDENKLVRQARRLGVAVHPASRFWQDGADASDGSGASVLINCGSIRAEDIPAAARLLRDAWGAPGF